MESLERPVRAKLTTGTSSSPFLCCRSAYCLLTVVVFSSLSLYATVSVAADRTVGWISTSVLFTKVRLPALPERYRHKGTPLT